MKSQFAHYKNRATGFGVRGLAVMLCFVMLLTAIGAGTMMTAFSAKADLTGSTAIADTAQKVVDIANSVDTEADDGIIPKITKKIADLADTGAKVDLAETGLNYYVWRSTNDSFNNDGGVTQNQMTVSGSTWSYTWSCNGSTNYYFRVSTSNSSSTSGNIITSSTAVATGDNVNSTENQEHDGNRYIRVNLKSAGNVVFTYDGDTLTITSGNTSGGGTDTWTVAGEPASIFHPGTTSTWETGNTDNDMFYEDGVYKKVYYNIPGNTKISFKVCKDHGWTTAYPGSNYDIAADATGNVSGNTLTITYDPSNNTVSHTLTAPPVFHDITFTHSNTGGTVTVNDSTTGTVTVAQGAAYTVEVEPEDGFVLNSLTVGGTDVTGDVSDGVYSGTMGAADITVAATFDYAGKVTDNDIKDVLAGTKVMIYGSENTGWQTHSPFYVMKTNSTGDAETQGDVNNSPTYTFGGTDNFGVTDPLYVTLRAADYYFGHWNSNLNTSISVNDAGKVYVVYGALTTGATVVKKDTQVNDNLYAISGGTTTVATTFPATVYQGYTAPVATGDPGTSVLGLTNTIEYYVKDGDNYYQVEADNGYIDTSAFAVKNGYQLITVLKDGNDLRVVADTDDFNVVAPDLKTIKIKSNNARLGTGTSDVPSTVPGQIVTITIHENMGTFSSIAVKDTSNNDIETTAVTAGETYTFVMPSTTATVNLTFTDYTASSGFYYNSYETNGSPSDTRYGVQMTEGKINGKKFSYYHVEGRTGNDQLFTVSYLNPDYPDNTAVYFTAPSSWEDNHGWDGDPYAIFYATDGTYIKDWSKMTYDGDDNGNKRWRIDIPDGAYKWQVKVDKGDYPKTMMMDLSWGGKDALFFIKEYGVDDTYHEYNQIGHTWFNHDNPVGDMYENFNGEGKYTNNFSTKGFKAHNASRGGSHAYTKPDGLGTDSGDYYIIVLYNGVEYTINGDTHTVDKDPEIIWMPKLPGTEDIDSAEVNVYAKDGPIVIDWNNKTASGATTTSGTAYGYSLIADTKLYDSDGTTKIGTDVDDDGASYEKAKVVVTSEDSADIVIKTTINSTYTSKYYLKGWNINGETYACGDNVKGVNAESAGTASGSDKVYTMKYTIPEGTEDSAKIEITPIYYLLSSYKTANEIQTVTFLLEGYNTIIEKWGDTPYIYPFYGDLNNVDNSFGVYPGQPMVYAAGQYSVEVPVNKNVPIAKEPSSTVVKGITISNGYADHVHRNLVYQWSDHDNDFEHKQTYDYDDFYKIYEECLKNGTEHPNSIIFRIQDEETVFNRAQYGGGKSGQFASGTSNIDINEIATSGNGWELLVNRYDNAVNIFGSHDGISNPGSGVTATSDTANALYVVSTGYNANIAGDYGTMWKVYNSSGQLISNAGGRVGIPPSVLLLRGNSGGYTTTITYPSANRSVDGVGSYTDSINDYLAVYKALHDSSYTNKRVYITYEKDAQDTRSVTSGTGANRLDGRWYYTHISDQVQSKIGIEYWDNAQNKWLTDTMNGVTGATTGCTAKFSNNSTTSPSYTIENNNTYSFSAAAVTGWKFDSWQIKYSETSYDQIAATESATMPATLSYNIVARFVPTTEGDLTITHTLNKASTGEGTVDMEVKVYTNSEKGTQVGETKTGSRVYLDGTVINNSSASDYVIEITLKTTPMYDGKVTQFTYDKFNTNNSITATTSPAELPGAENTLTTSTFTIPVSSLYNVGTLKTRTLDYTSLIDETLHYYNFTYTFTSRGSATSNDKSYTSKGVMGLTEYKKLVADQAAHTLDNSILVDKAPFESNFLKSNTLTKGSISYTGETHTYSATSTFNQSDAIPKYHVTFELPYNYLATGDASATPATKKYTVTNEKTYVASPATFSLLAEYNTFVTIDATETEVGTQAKVEKVTDGSDINHAGNDFITAPEELNNSGTTMYFRYWEIKKLKSDGSAGDDVAKIYYPDFHYRVYSDYYVKAVYSENAENSWKFQYSEDVNTDIDCSILYLGDSRNQWNDGNVDSDASADTASDLIYSDFIFHYTYKGQEIKNSDNLEVGMILERATYYDTKEMKNKWLSGSTSVNDMSYYRATYGGDGDNSTEAARKTAILTALNGNSSLPSGTIKAVWDKTELNNKNFTEQSYKAYSQYGQTVANDTIAFAQDNVIDNYVYRAYAYVKDGSGYTLSDPVYFCMRYTSNLKYTE